jgi:proton-coupled amino acid transporter
MSKNITRTILVAITVVFTILLKDSLDDFLSLLGAVTCTPIAFAFPAMFHLKAVADTKFQKIIDVLIILLSLGIFVGCSILDIEAWIKHAQSE